MNTPHPHKALIDAITSGAAVEFMPRVKTGWIPTDAAHALYHGVNYGWENVRLAPAKTHREAEAREAWEARFGEGWK